jgi:hypothetical protein
MLLNAAECIGIVWNELWPQFPQPVGMETVWFRPFELTATEAELSLRSALLFDGPLALGLPGLDAITLVLAAHDAGELVPFTLTLFPEPAAAITARAALRVDPALLRPVRRIAGAPGDPDSFEVDPSVTHVEVPLGQLTLRVDGDGNVDVGSEGGLALPPCMVANTGVVVEASDVALYLSRTASPPGRPPGWRGIHLGLAQLHLPGELGRATGALAVAEADIGLGGFSGTVSTTWDPPLAANVMGYDFALQRVALTFVQNALTTSEIVGACTLPFFDQPLGIELGLGLDGAFTVGISDTQPPGVTRRTDGLLQFTKPGLLTLGVARLALDKRGDDIVITLGGRIKLLYGGFDWPELEVKELAIDRSGHIHIDGGWLELPESAALDFGGFSMQLDQIGFGNADDGRRWIGVSGQIRLVDELAFGASVDGLKILWDSTGHVDLQLSRIAVELSVPDALSFKGFVEYFVDDTAKGFRGDVTLTLDAGPVAFDGRLMIGRNSATPPYAFFYIVVDADLPIGMPLGQTNTAIYGFSGLLGNNVAPTKEADLEWYDWYRRAPIGATPVTKWSDARGRLALGAGVTLGTAADNGFAFAAKVILVLLVPGPLLLLDGKANMLKDRAALSGPSEGDYRSLAVLDRRAGTLRVNMQPHYLYDPVTGAMVDVLGVAEGFFDFDEPDAWHLYLGETPPSKRIRGTVFKLLRADAYLMLDRAGIRLGASVGIDKHYDYGALSVALRGTIDGEAAVSWRPTQLDGTLTIEGLAALRAFGSSASVSVDAALRVQAPRPLHVDGSVRVKLRTPWPLPDPSARVRFEWQGSGEEEPPPATIAAVVGEHLLVTQTWPLELTAPAHTLGVGTSPLVDRAPGSRVPLDAKLVITFARPVVDRALIGANGGPTPRPERVGDREIVHELLAVTLERRDGADWTVVESRDGGSGDLFGMWLPLPDEEHAAGKLQLWGRSPFSYSRATGRTYADWFTATRPEYPCIAEEPAGPSCVDFDASAQRVFPALFTVGDLVFQSFFEGSAPAPRIVPYASALTGTKRALRVSCDAALSLRITPLARCASVNVFVSVPAGIAVTLHAFAGDASVATASSGPGPDVELVVTARDIEYVELTATDSAPILVLRVCATSQVDRDRADLVDALRRRLKDELSPAADWCGEDHLLAPDSEYRLTVTTQIRTSRDGDEIAAVSHDDCVVFRTEGPPGFLGDAGRLRDLGAYVDPNASAPIHGAPAVYRGDDIRVVFTENYMERLYKGTGHDLVISVLDRNGQSAAAITTVWDRDPYGTPAIEHEVWRWAVGRPTLAAAGCTSSVGDECIARRSTLEGRLLDAPLPPRALIDTRITAAGRPPLHRLTFTTSRFVTFIDHVQSFAGVVRQRYVGTGDPAALGAAEAARFAEIVEARRHTNPGFDAAAEAAAFDDLLSRVFKLDLRDPADELQISLVRDSDRRYALLLDSPEPLDWSRTGLAIRSAPTANAAPRPPADTVRIIGAALAPSSGAGDDVNAEWVDILVATARDPRGISIEYSNDLGEPTSFAVFYRFGEESVVPDGTVIRIHSGAPPEGPPINDGRFHRYVTVSGQMPTWRLSSSGVVMRLLKADGTEVQRRAIMPLVMFEDRQFVIVRSRDETRAFVIFDAGPGVVGDVPVALIRLEWTFRRDVGAAGVLRPRQGRSHPEQTAVEFSVD